MQYNLLTVDKKGNTIMTQSQFAELCAQYTIDPSIALENDDVIQAIKSGDIALLNTILTNQF